MPLKRSATAVWQGTGQEGKGTLETQSGALQGLPYSAHARFGAEDGRAGTNPEELLGAAHAGCFAMALAFGLTAAGHAPARLEARATVQIDREGVHWTVTGIHLDVTAQVPGVAATQFQEIAEATKKSCPISKALASVPITLSARLAWIGPRAGPIASELRPLSCTARSRRALS